MGADLELVVDGRPVRFPAVWLRDNCPCPDCLAPGTGQKLKDITDIPNGLAITRTEDAGESVLVTFAPDQHRSAFPRTWLEAHALGDDADGDGRTEDGKELWLPADLAELPAMSWPSYLAGGKAEALEAVLRVGFVLLSGLSAVPGRVLDVAASFGYVRETNYGRLFDVRVEPAPGNLAFTSRAIRPHTDNPYRDPVPTVQLLHCLHNAAEGGDSGFVDGFHAAAALRAQDPAAFATLAVTPVTFGYRDAATELSATRPLISLDPQGRIREIRINPRSLQPVRLPGPRAAAFYAAYAAFAELLSAAPSMLTVACCSSRSRNASAVRVQVRVGD